MFFLRGHLFPSRHHDHLGQWKDYKYLLILFLFFLQPSWISLKVRNQFWLQLYNSGHLPKTPHLPTFSKTQLPQECFDWPNFEKAKNLQKSHLKPWESLPKVWKMTLDPKTSCWTHDKWIQMIFCTLMIHESIIVVFLLERLLEKRVAKRVAITFGKCTDHMGTACVQSKLIQGQLHSNVHAGGSSSPRPRGRRHPSRSCLIIHYWAQLSFYCISHAHQSISSTYREIKHHAQPPKHKRKGPLS